MDFRKQRRTKLSGLRTFIVHDMGEFCSIRLILIVSAFETKSFSQWNELFHAVEQKVSCVETIGFVR